MIVVSDASPLIALATVGQLDLLRALYGRVAVPVVVYQEVTEVRPAAPGAAIIRAAKWIAVRPVEDRVLVDALSLNLDAGEAEAIALAVETNADLLLMDERRGRAAAMTLGRRVVGVVGVLIEAKMREVLAEVAPVLDSLRADAGFRISDELRARALAAAGE